MFYRQIVSDSKNALYTTIFPTDDAILFPSGGQIWLNEADVEIQQPKCPPG